MPDSKVNTHSKDRFDRLCVGSAWDEPPLEPFGTDLTVPKTLRNMMTVPEEIWKKDKQEKLVEVSSAG